MAIHILISANQAWNIYNFRRGLINHFLDAGNRVTVLAPPDACSDKLRELGCEVIDVQISSQGINPFGDLLLLCRFFRHYRNLKPDLIVNYTIKPNIYGSIATGLANIPSIAVTTGLGYTFINNGLVAKFAKFLYRVSLRFPRQVWFLNSDDREVFLEHRLVQKRSTFVLNGEGIDTAAYAPQSKLVHDNVFRFLLIGRMLKDKGVIEYVEAAQKLMSKYPNVVFQLLGATGTDNPSAIGESTINQWEKAGIVEYLGTTNDVRPFIASADCVVLPSYREGVPRTLMEAAAMAKPIVATDVPGCRSVVDDGINGYLCKAQNADDLASKLEMMLTCGHEQRTRMGLSGRKKVIEEFDEKLVIEQYVGRIDEILAA
jgi:glycosyltransferase involved in cell wall biosynthesis